jgi:predicted component of type VI protein secretion system
MAEQREARLFVLAGSDLARSFPLAERNVVGRAEGCEIVLRDRSISRRHAVIVRQGEQWFAQDLGSTNGISKDGERKERFELVDGDEFKLGDLPVRFKFQAVAGEEIEFESPITSAGKAPSPAPAAPAGPAREAPGKGAAAGLADEVEIEIEEEIEIEGAGVPGARRPAPLPATSFRPPRAERRTGLFAGDIEQRPFWMRVLVFLVLLALAVALGLGVFRAVQMLRDGL